MPPHTLVTHGPGIPPAAGPYSPAVVVGDTCYLSGQIALDPAGALVGEDAAAQTVQVMSNIGAVLDAAGFRFEDLVLVTILLADIADFASVNDAYAAALPERVRPARVTYQAGALPLGALVEIQTTAVRQR
ncbi:RidA family protein [Streptomyces sp. NPDC001663]|uniref:RidA family protein n=1 Tax=Streptomyces sp. NPDC001663 TaxID=3364597 RepID=UPI0036BB9D8D